MDRVRFGRALGGGARAAAKALIKAADAAAAPNSAAPNHGIPNHRMPNSAAPNPAPRNSAAKRAGEVVERAGEAATRTAGLRAEQAKAAAQGVKREGKRFGEAVWGPFVKQSGVLWLEFTKFFRVVMGVSISQE